MIVLCIVVFIYFIFNIASIVNVFMLSIEKKTHTFEQSSWENLKFSDKPGNPESLKK